MHIQITSMHLIAWDPQPFRILLDAITNHNPFLMPFFRVLNTINIDWASAVKSGQATGMKAWKLVTTYIGDNRDKLANTFRNAGQNWPPGPSMVGGMSTPAALATVTLGCFTNGTIAQVVTNSLSPLSGQHLYDGSGVTV